MDTTALTEKQTIAINTARLRPSSPGWGFVSDVITTTRIATASPMWRRAATGAHFGECASGHGFGTAELTDTR
jgi:hypothetical protein